MSIKTATAPQRQALRDKLSIATTGVHRIAQNVHAPLSDAEAAPIQRACAAASAALVAVGIGSAAPLPTQKLVSNGAALVVKNAAGTPVAGSHTAVVAAGVLNAKLAPTVATVVSGLSTVAAKGTGTKVTFTVAHGVITAITLSE